MCLAAYEGDAWADCGWCHREDCGWHPNNLYDKKTIHIKKGNSVPEKVEIKCIDGSVKEPEGYISYHINVRKR